MAEINWYTKERMAERLSVSVETIDLWRAKKGMPSHQPGGGRVLFDPEEVDAWIQSGATDGQAGVG